MGAEAGGNLSVAQSTGNPPQHLYFALAKSCYRGLYDEGYAPLEAYSLSSSITSLKQFLTAALGVVR